MTFISEPQPSAAFAWTQPSPAVGPALVCEPLGRAAHHLFTAGQLALRDDVREWQAVALSMGLAAEDLRLVRQVHRTDIAVIRPGAGKPWSTPDADIVICDDPAVAIVVRVADCAPILIADPARPAVAAIHAGWRGTMQRAVAAGVEAMRRELGCEPRDLVAAIGPCLGVCCGEVGPDVPDAFSQAGHSGGEVDRWFSVGPAGRPHVNLVRANRDQLEQAGLLRGNIHAADLCTRSYPDVFHSYRAAGPGGGRMAGVIRARHRGFVD